MSGKGSRNKGAKGELEFARVVRSHGFDCERSGRNGRTSEDVTHSIPGVHLEVKRDERLSVDAMVRQAERDAGDLEPVVGYRRNRQPWRVVVNADEYLRTKAELEKLRARVVELEQEPARFTSSEGRGAHEPLPSPPDTVTRAATAPPDPESAPSVYGPLPGIPDSAVEPGDYIGRF